MHIHFEKSINAQTDCTILSLSWMGKVPDELPEDEGWKLNRNHYYQEGWLATGNVHGILGVTYTTSHWKKPSNSTDVPQRTNYNLRGHRSQVTLVQWNEPYQKLASCDSSGIIFVWIKFEGRWSIELINDRNTPVTHFSWSHDGRMALICYQDGFVLVGSVAGQRYWSTALNVEGTVTCGIWTPDDQQVYFGTSNGQIVVMDVHGTMLSQVQLPSDSPIAAMSWSCEKFKMEENEDGEPTHYSNKRPFVFAVCFTTGGIYLMKHYDDIAPIYIFTNMHNLKHEWSNSGEFLAIAGSRPVEVVNESGEKVKEYSNHLHIYNTQGVRILNLTVPYTKSPVTALTWGHNDKRIFIATGKVIHVGWVSKRIASLQLLCRLTIYKSLSTETCVSHLPLPMPVRALISSLHTQTIVSILPNMRDLRDFVIHPPPCGRVFCTMIRHDEDTNQSPGTVYTLYVEYMGGLVPILKGKRTSKIRPEFVIFDPQAQSPPSESGSHSQTTTSSSTVQNHHNPNHPPHISSSTSGESGGRNNVPATTTTLTTSSSSQGYSDDSSESDDVELCASPRMQRKRYRNRQRRERERMLVREREREWERTRSSVHLMLEPTPAQQLVYSDILPESLRLVEVTSNIWGTKFKIHSLVSSLPEHLGSVTYKTSLLHLQPRQMTLLITELRDDIFLSPDNVYTQAEEEEEDFSVIVGNDSIHHHNLQHNSGAMPGVSVENYHGHHVIYHPQGAGSPQFPTNRCFLESRSSNTSRDHVAPTCTSPQPPQSSQPGTSGTSSSPSSAALVNNPCEMYSDDDEFPYVDLLSNPDMMQLREKLRERGGGVSMTSSSTIPGSNNPTHKVTAPVQGQTVCQDNEPSSSSSSSFIPILRRPSVESCSSGGVKVELRPTSSISGSSSPPPSQFQSSNNFVTRAQVEKVDENMMVNAASPKPLASASSSSVSEASSCTKNSNKCWTKDFALTSTTTSPPRQPILSIPPVIQPTTAPIPLHVRRSISASFLDGQRLSLDFASNDIVNGPQNSLALKRLVLVKKDGFSSTTTSTAKPKLRDCGKSKSWDSCDISWWRSNFTSKECGTGIRSSPPCPNCNFPTSLSSAKKSLLLHHNHQDDTVISQRPSSSGGTSSSSKIPPSTPAKSQRLCSNSNYNTISTSIMTSGGMRQTNSTQPHPQVPPTPARFAGRTRSRSQSHAPPEDRIERLPSPARSSSDREGNVLNGAASPPSPVPPVVTPNTHRRSLSLLTPLLRRRDLNSRLNHQQNVKGSSASNNNPPSSSFIPPGSPQHQARSNPCTPATPRRARSYLASASSPLRQLFANSPLLSRRKNKASQQQQQVNRNLTDSSDEEERSLRNNNSFPRSTHRPTPDSPVHSRTPRASLISANSNSSNIPYRDVENFQRQQLRQKLRNKKIHDSENCPIPRRREFLLRNKAPVWNETSQVYQLDFGGRVTQESAKNFQIEFRGKQVMQFGRIDGNAYTLDFQYPFSAIQAFAVALANVTQRLK